MAPRVAHESQQFLDGSEIEVAVRTNDATIVRIFTTDLTRRFRHAQRLFATETSLATFGGFAPAGRSDTSQSTTTHALPDGEVTVSIDASGAGSHEYLQYLVRGAVAYTHTLHVEAGRAGLLAILLLGCGLALVGFGWGYPSVPFFGAGGVISLHLVVYWLSARGIAPSLSRIPEPGKPPR